MATDFLRQLFEGNVIMDNLFHFRGTRFSRFHLAAGIALGFLAGAVSTEASAAPICPQFVAKYCVYNSHHLIFTAETNPCFAKQRHWTVIYQGQCRFGHR
jgi:hypothetical protein